MNKDSKYIVLNRITLEIGRPDAVFFDNDGKIETVRANFGEGVHYDTLDLLPEDAIIYTERDDEDII